MTIRFTTRLKISTYSQLKKFSNIYGISINASINLLLKRILDETEANQPPLRDHLPNRYKS